MSVLLAIVALLAAVCACSSSGRRSRIVIDSDVFAVVGRYGSSNETIVVSGSFSDRAGVAALNRFRVRAMNVDERGTEHHDVYASPPLDASGDVLYTPNYTSEPTITPRGIGVYVDCKGAIEAPMRVRFLAILRDELASLGNVHVSNGT